MTLRPLATRVPKELEKEIHEVMEFTRTEKARAVRLILELGLVEWRKKTALDLLREGKTTFSKAAALAKLDVWDFADLVKERKVEWVRIPPEEFEAEFKHVSKERRE